MQPAVPPRLDRFAALGILVVSALLVAPLVDGASWPETHDNNFRYFWLVEHFRDALAHGIVYPRWLPDAFGGYGAPMFVYYQPAFFYVGALFSALIADPIHAFTATLWFYLSLGGIGAYCVARRFGGPWAAFLAALFFLLTPYLYTNLHVRGDVTEFAGMLLLPWPIVGLLALARERSRSRRKWSSLLAATALALAAIPVTHPAVGLFFYPCFALFAVSLMRDAVHSRAFGLTVAATFVIACGMTAPYWATFLYMRQHVMFDALHSGYFVASEHLVQPRQLVSRFWGHGASVPGAGDGMAFSLGAVHLAIAFVGAFVGRSVPLVRMAALLYAGLVLLMLPIAAPIWKRVAFLSGVQFPWRILGATAVLQFVLACGLLRARRNVAVVTLAAAIVLVFAWSPSAFVPNPRRHADARSRILAHSETYLDVFHSYTEPTSDALLAPSATKLREAGPRGNRPLVTLDNARGCRPAAGHSTHDIRFALTPGSATQATVHQMYLAGWQVSVDGVSIAPSELEASLTRFGTMRVDVPEDALEIRARYGGPPRARGVNLLAALAVVAASLLWIAALPRLCSPVPDEES